jgi:hypothetical protein
MSRAVYRISFMLHALWCFTAIPAFADTSSEDIDDRWIPSIAVVIGFTAHEHHGEAYGFRTLTAFGTTIDVPMNNTRACLEPTNAFNADCELADNDRSLNNIQAGGSIELATPPLFKTKWAPRLFFGGEVGHVSAQKRQIAREGDPSDLREPDVDKFPSESILGQGTETTSDAEDIFYGASLGVSFPVQLGEWRINIKPSARYINQKYNFNGVLLNAERADFLGTGPTTSVELYGSDSLNVHALGPGLEIEIEAVRIQSFAGSVFISGGGYKVLSDRSTTFSASGTDNFGEGDYSGVWSAKVERWMYRASAGVRIKWLGASSGWLGLGD